MLRTWTSEDGPTIQENGGEAIKRPNPVFLWQITEECRVQTNEGELEGHVDDFLAYDPISGHVWPVQNEYVTQHYDFVEK